MNAIEIIDKKRKHIELSKEEIDFFFKSYLSGEIPDYQVSSLLMAICLNGMSDMETFYLTDVFIETGSSIDLSSIEGIKVDKHSTGGIGDKTTLVLGPVLASCGIKMCKMSGRGLGLTGGTIDKLESIPGFRTDLTSSEMVEQVKKMGLSLSGQTDDLVPLDKLVYALRDVTATVESVPLIISSIMSKKISSGADTIYIDLKVGSGALVKNATEAEKVIDLMERIGIRYKKAVIVGISDMNTPLGSSVGNAVEVIEAINTLQGKAGNNFSKMCTKMVVDILMISKKIDEVSAREEAARSISSGDAYNKFVEMVKYQGGDLSKLKVSGLKEEIRSPKTGTVVAIDAFTVGEVANKLGAGRKKKEEAIDHSVGVVLAVETGDEVKEGDLLCTIYYNQNKDFGSIDKAFSIFTEEEMIKFYKKYKVD